ncbi:MAG: hypothetical protein RLY86_2082 [Pseudomonadota bacterium]|jgi:hypothetical protein
MHRLAARAALPAIAVLCAGLSVAGLPLVGRAQPAGGPVDAVLACARLTEGAERLACYDRTVPALRNAPVAAAAAPAAPAGPSVGTPGAPRVAGSAAAAAAPAQGLGAGRLARPETEATATDRALTAMVTGMRRLANGRTALELDNGHIWVQTEAERLPVKVGDRITIETALLGSFNLKTERVSRIFKVERVR